MSQLPSLTLSSVCFNSFVALDVNSLTDSSDGGCMCGARLAWWHGPEWGSILGAVSSLLLSQYSHIPTGARHTTYQPAPGLGELSSSTKSWGDLLSVDKSLFVWQLDINECIRIYSMLLWSPCDLFKVYPSAMGPGHVSTVSDVSVSSPGSVESKYLLQHSRGQWQLIRDTV